MNVPPHVAGVGRTAVLSIIGMDEIALVRDGVLLRRVQ